MPSETEDHMTEILTELWGLPEAEPFHHEADKDTLPDCPPKCLRQIGERLDSSSYATLADFAEDLRDVLKSLKGYYDVSGGSPDMFKKEQASSCLSTFEKMLVDITGTKAAKKRPRASPSSTTPKAAPSAPNSAKSSRAPTSAPLSREQKLEQGLNLLCDYIVDCGGGRDLLDGWYTSIELRKDGKTQGTTDMYYFSATGKKFRSRAEVARHFRLAAAPPKRQAGAKKKMLTYSTERKRVEREINKLSANRVKAEAKLTELGEDQVKSTYPIDDDLLVQRGEAAPQTLPVPGGEGLPGIPADSLTDLFAVWDFLTTFDKTLLLSVTTLEDFATAITCDAGVFLAEAHVGMMRLLLSDEANDDWWKREPLPGDPAPPPAADPVPPPAAPEEKKEDDDSSEDESEDEKSDDEEDKMDIVEDDTPKSRTIAELLLSTCEKPSSLAILPVNFPLYAGIVCERVLDMYAKRRIAADNEIRDSKGLPLLTREEVQSRRASTAVRLFPPCSDGSDNDVNPLDGAIAALSRGDEYTSLNAAQKILILRLLVEALYETDRVRNVVEDNTNSRANAEKKLEDETRQQARGEREAWQAIQARAKEEMYSRQKEEFLEEQRKEMRADDPENEMLDWSNDQLLEDEAISAQCEASLAAPTKNEILEAAQLLKKKTDLGEGEVRIVTLDELSEIDSEALRKLEEEASSTVYDVDDLDSSEARETLGRQDISALKDLKYRRDQARLKVEEYAPARVAYVDMLEEAVATDDIKMLRNAIKAARMYVRERAKRACLICVYSSRTGDGRRSSRLLTPALYTSCGLISSNSSSLSHRSQLRLAGPHEHARELHRGVADQRGGGAEGRRGEEEEERGQKEFGAAEGRVLRAHRAPRRGPGGEAVLGVRGRPPEQVVDRDFVWRGRRGRGGEDHGGSRHCRQELGEGRDGWFLGLQRAGVPEEEQVVQLRDREVVPRYREAAGREGREGEGAQGGAQGIH